MDGSGRARGATRPHHRRCSRFGSRDGAGAPDDARLRCCLRPRCLGRCADTTRFDAVEFRDVAARADHGELGRQAYAPSTNRPSSISAVAGPQVAGEEARPALALAPRRRLGAASQTVWAHRAAVAAVSTQLGRAGGHLPRPRRAPPFVHASERRRVQASDARPGRRARVRSGRTGTPPMRDFRKRSAQDSRRPLFAPSLLRPRPHGSRRAR